MKYLRCPKCKILEEFFKCNIREKSTLAIYNELNPRIRQSDGLHIYPMYCFICKSVTEWAMDPLNSSTKAFKGVEYFKTKKATNKDIRNIIVILKNSKGDPTKNRLNVVIDLSLLDSNDNLIISKQFSESFEYNIDDNKFNLKQYEKNIKFNLIEDITQQILVFLANV